METVRDFIFLGSKITVDGDYSHEITLFSSAQFSPSMLAPWKKSYDKPRQGINKLRHYFAIKGPSSQSYVVMFSSSYVWM